MAAARPCPRPLPVRLAHLVIRVHGLPAGRLDGRDRHGLLLHAAASLPRPLYVALPGSRGATPDTAGLGVARSIAGQPTSASYSACSALPPPFSPNRRLANSR